jgi:hypothetical protein
MLEELAPAAIQLPEVSTAAATLALGTPMRVLEVGHQIFALQPHWPIA